MSTTATTQPADTKEQAKDAAGASGRPSGPGFMARARVIARREILSYFVSAIAYVAMALFLLVSGLAFWADFDPGKPAMMRNVFDWMLWVFMLVVPLLCMGSLASEWASGTIESLMTAPVTDSDVVMGKFLGAFGFLCVLIAPTVLYPIIIASYATPRLDFGPIVSGYLGMLFAGALFVSVSLFCSSLTRSQIVAAVSAIAILASVTILPWLVGAVTSLPDFWRFLVNQTVYPRYADFSKGVIDSAHVIFFIAFTALFLFLTVKVLESRRWK